MNMSPTEDLRVRIEQIDGKVNSLHVMVTDLKVTTMGIAAIERSLGQLGSDLRNAIDNFSKTSEKTEKLTTRVEFMEGWRNWIMGGLAVIGVIGAMLLGGLYWTIGKVIDGGELNAVQERRIFQLEHK